jgi:hypothetical protein
VPLKEEAEEFVEDFGAAGRGGGVAEPEGR